MKTAIQIKKENKIICVLNGRYVMDYDNFQWSELALLVNVARKGFKDKEEFLKNLEEAGSRFYEVEAGSSDSPILDLDTNTFILLSFPIYKFEEVNKDNCCIDLLKKDDRYYAVYEDEEVLMNYVSFDKDLLTKTTMTFDELSKVNDFVNSLLDTGYTDFVLNNECVIRLNCM